MEIINITTKNKIYNIAIVLCTEITQRIIIRKWNVESFKINNNKENM